eukprot:1371308-Amphidinium_carterae.2
MAIQKSYHVTTPSNCVQKQLSLRDSLPVSPGTGCDLNAEFPHPSLLRAMILANDSSLTEQWGCRSCS